jgi:hypothetical protein
LAEQRILDRYSALTEAARREAIEEISAFARSEAELRAPEALFWTTIKEFVEYRLAGEP